MKLENLMMHCISLQSKRNERYMKIYKYYDNLNLKEEIAIDGNNKNYIKKLERVMNLKFDKFASDSNKALFIKSLMLWQKHLDNSYNYTIIIEDDVIPVDNFSIKFNKIVNELPKDFDICVMTGVVFGKPKSYRNLLYKKVSFSCIGAYLLSKNGAKKLVEIAKNNVIKTHNSGGVLDYWVCCNKDKLNFYKTKEDLFTLLNIPSSLAISRCKLLEKYIPKLDKFLKNNYIITIMLNRFGINGKITISWYLFLNIFLNYVFLKLLGINFLVMILFFFHFLDIKLSNYLLEEKLNKLLEIILSVVIIIWI